MNPNDNPFAFKPPQEEDLPECDERLYWHKRFNFASWLFLFFGIWAIFASSTAKAAIIAISASFGFRVFDSICQARHWAWHWKKNGGGRDFR